MEAIQIGPGFAAEMRGVTLADVTNDDAAYAEVRAAFEKHSVLVFRDQDVSDESQLAFSRRFGPPEVTKVGSLGTGTHFVILTTIGKDGKVVPPDHRYAVRNKANQLWHTDSSFKYVPARCSLLSAREIPPEGGDTEFADLRAAYDALPEEMKRRLDGLVAEHSIFHSRSKTGFVNFTAEIRRTMPPVPQLVLRRHAGSGRQTLYLASHASHIIGWPMEEGRRLIEELIEFATEPRFVYRHCWRVGDLVIWDDRCTMHRGRPYDDVRHRRVLHRTTVSDELNSVERERRGTAA